MSNTFTNRFASITLVAVLAAGCASAPQQVAETAEQPSEAIEQTSALPSLPAIEVVATPPVKPKNEKAFAMALEHMREGRFESAQALLQKITASQPELAGPWANLGQVYVKLEDAPRARDAFERAVQANPSNCQALNQLGVLARQEGNFSQAEQAYQNCLSARPDFRDAYLNLGILYELYLGRLPEALAAYRQYQTLSPKPDRKVRGWVMDLERRLGV